MARVPLPCFQTPRFGAAWFGIFVTVIAEFALIAPPVGLNDFVIRAQRPGLALGTISRGIAWFRVADAALVALLLAFAALALSLPRVPGI